MILQGGVTHIWLDSNPLPEIDSDDQAFCDRLHPIPFTVTIPDDQIDRDMPQKLLTEGAGILAKLVVGAVRYFKSGLVLLCYKATKFRLS
jgi:putative DNA primase/helicase